MDDPTAMMVTIVDGYVDEPAHFGVPPYLSTYPRYVAGALIEAGVPREQITYHTIDALREDRRRWTSVESADLLVYVGGMTVPGKYVGGTPAEPEEVRELAWVSKGTSLLGGPVRFGVGERNEGASETDRKDLDFDFVAGGDIEAAAFDLVTNGLEGFANRMRSIAEVSRWAPLGSFIVEQHPNYPDYLICELETARGCPYRCSFCTEPLYGSPTFRPPESVIEEVNSLYDHGVRHFRLGRQADLLAYGGDGEAPHPPSLERLYRGIRSVAPDLGTLHLDNINPVTIIEYPDRAREGLSIIARYNTPGDTAAFGLESADPAVQEENNLLVSADECFEAVRIVNEIGGFRPGQRPDAEVVPSDRVSALPKLLPGINLVHGLAGERAETYEYNRRFLNRILDADLLVRRVNIRQVMAFPGTEMSTTGASIAHEHKQQFKRYKRDIRETFDQPMLRRVAPLGTQLRDVHLEYHEGGLTFGRELGTYPLLVGIPGEHQLGDVIDIAVTDHGFRSVTGVPYPVDLNEAPLNILRAIPGIGKDRAAAIVVDRPYSQVDEVPVDVDIRQYVTVDDRSEHPTASH